MYAYPRLVTTVLEDFCERPFLILFQFFTEMALLKFFILETIVFQPFLTHYFAALRKKMTNIIVSNFAIINQIIALETVLSLTLI